MFFERFDWEEEKLGLISGLSFVLIGVFGYALYYIYGKSGGMNFLSIGALTGTLIAAALTAILFQLPRIKGTRAALSTFSGGIMLGVSVILWVITGALFPSSDILLLLGAFGISFLLMVLTFFAIGFLVLALYPEGTGYSEQRVETSAPKMHEEEEENIIDRL